MIHEITNPIAKAAMKILRAIGKLQESKIITAK
jgi:hypothetical protein